MSRYRFVSTMKAEGFPVDAACTVAEVSTSAYYKWLGRAASPSEAELAEAYLVNQIRDIHADSDATYGSPGDGSTPPPGLLREPQAHRAAHVRERHRRGHPPQADTADDHAGRRGSTPA